MFRRVRTVFFLSLLSASLPAGAEAQVYFGAYLGANHTLPADVSIDVPAKGLAVRFEDVEWEGKPFASPQYYGFRGGAFFGARRRFGLEVEFLHAKMIAKIDSAMQAVVQRYSMTHGLNFLTVNVVSRFPIGTGPVSFIARAGAGPTLPHAETNVLGRVQEQYQYAGMGMQAAAGVDVRLIGRLSAMGEYKFTFAKPTITLADGTGQTTAAAHQVIFGLTIALSK